jgi:hypothetical protein
LVSAELEQPVSGFAAVIARQLRGALAVDHFDRKVQTVVDDPRGSDRSAERTDEDPVNPTSLQNQPVTTCLVDAGVRQR